MYISFGHQLQLDGVNRNIAQLLVFMKSSYMSYKAITQPILFGGVHNCYTYIYIKGLHLFNTACYTYIYI